MKLISSREAVDFLSQAAPRPWVQRLLRWLAFDEGLTIYSNQGRVQPYTSVISLTLELREEAGEMSGARMDEVIRKNFSPELAAKLVSKNPSDRVDDEPNVWNPSDGPKTLPVGFLFYAEEVNLDDGYIRSEYVPYDRGMFRILFDYDDDLIGSEFKDPDFDFEISGLSFEYRQIEMLLPQAKMSSGSVFSADVPEKKRKAGRPAKWGWEDVMAHVVSMAQQPDGLPTGPGAQARIEEMIAEWFVQETGDSPAASQIRQRAAKIVRLIDPPKMS